MAQRILVSSQKSRPGRLSAGALPFGPIIIKTHTHSNKITKLITSSLSNYRRHLYKLYNNGEFK